MAYIFGVAQSNGLKPYIANQFSVDDAHLSRFAQGLLDRVNTDPNDKDLAAYNAGGQIGDRIVSMTKQFSDDYYSADKDKSIDGRIVANGIIAGLMEQSEIPVDSASRLFQSRMTERQAANKEKLYGANRAAGEKFLEENRTKPGVVGTASGLQYKILTQGTGKKPAATDKVKVHYEGRLIDGTVFDSSYKRGEPTSFGVKQVIAGWTEALQLMPVGSKWELYIPYQLAYGDRETGKEIKPYSALIFTVELLGIE
ncbi:MAG: FKBP-type peptidyl-prolyl cis-trans isomerase [Bacteroidaceae bacterium]|nr:FKBP-type peptidyl-prolyl cis-trans isomerase [Bacteroidaceae bacterium]